MGAGAISGKCGGGSGGGRRELCHLSSKQARNVEYIMVDSQPTISKAGAESSKWRIHGCAIFFMCETWMMSNGTEMTSSRYDVFRRILMTPIRTKNQTTISYSDIL